MNIITLKRLFFTYDYFLSQFYECKDWFDVVEYNGVLVISGNYKNLSQVLSWFLQVAEY